MQYRVLSIASWYPNPTDAFDGDFVQRHVQAIASEHSVVNIHVLNDDKGKFQHQPLQIRRVHSQLVEYTLFIQKARTGLRFLDSLLNNYHYTKLGEELIERVLKEEQFEPDIIHAHVTIKAGLLALRIKKKYGIPLVLTEHWTAYLKPLGAKMKYFSRKVWKQVDRLLPVSENLNAHIQSVQKVPATVVPNVVNVQSFFPFPTEKSVSPFVFFHVSTLNENKNPEGLFRVVKRLADEQMDFVLRIAGQNQEKYKAFCSDLGIPEKYVEFLGTILYQKVGAYMQTANAFVLFSNFENLPCVLLESLCCGTPIITTDAGGCGEIVTPENGILIARKDENALYKAMHKMMTQPEEYKKESIAQAAQEKYSYAAVAKAYTNVYNSLILL